MRRVLRAFLAERLAAPAGHPEHARGERVRKQWQKDFGLSYVKKTPKGIALLDVTP